MLLSKLGKTKKIYARKCSLSKITATVAEPFVNSTHIDGYYSTIEHYGLFYDNILTQCITFNPHTSNNPGHYVLERMDTLHGIAVVGGASKLLKFAINDLGATTVDTFCRRVDSTANVYKKIGFELVNIAQPGFCWSNIYYNTISSIDSKAYSPNALFAAGYRRYWNQGSYYLVYRK